MKDGIQAFADEVTLMRRELDKLQRTSLDKEEAKALHGIVAKAVKDMRQATADAPQALQGALKVDRDRMAQNATQAAIEAAERVLGDIREQLAQERLKLSQAAGEARRAAWRSFGGFWVWLASVGAAGAFLGLLAAHVAETAKSLLTVEQMVRYGCGEFWGSGQLVEQDDGSSYCAHWIVTPQQTRAGQEQGR